WASRLRTSTSASMCPGRNDPPGIGCRITMLKYGSAWPGEALKRSTGVTALELVHLEEATQRIPVLGINPFSLAVTWWAFSTCRRSRRSLQDAGESQSGAATAPP